MGRNRTVGVPARDAVWEFINELLLEVEVKPDLVSISKVESEKCPFRAFSKLPDCTYPTFSFLPVGSQTSR